MQSKGNGPIQVMWCVCMWMMKRGKFNQYQSHSSFWNSQIIYLLISAVAAYFFYAKFVSFHSHIPFCFVVVDVVIASWYSRIARAFSLQHMFHCTSTTLTLSLSQQAILHSQDAYAPCMFIQWIKLQFITSKGNQAQTARIVLFFYGFSFSLRTLMHIIQPKAHIDTHTQHITHQNQNKCSE